jgi:hypothetical protein
MKHPIAALALAGTAFLLAAVPAQAKGKPDVTAPPAIFQAVVDCRTIAESAQRLACFDRTVGEMATATTQKDLVILDRESMRETRKGLFGFNLPRLKLFGGGDEDESDVVKEIESTISGLRSAKDGFPIFTIADGARWKQTDGRNTFPKIGQKIRIKAATLGSYMASIDGRAGVRVMRLPE